MSKIVHDKGVSRLSCLLPSFKGRTYVGFICKKCFAPILALEHRDQKAPMIPVIGEGKFDVPCRRCRTDSLIYTTSEMQLVTADIDDPNPTPSRPRATVTNKPRQPIASRYRDAKPSFGTRFLEDRPDCAVVIARCISNWTYVEISFALLLASLLRIDTAPALAIYQTIQNSRLQQQVLAAAAETILVGDDFELLEAIINVSASIEKERNDLTHGVYGGSILIEQGIIWAAQKDVVAHTVGVWSSNYENVDTKTMLPKTFVYEVGDLETIAQKIEWLAATIDRFRGYCSSPATPQRVELYHQLCVEPLLGSELHRMRAGLRKTD